MTRRSTAVSKSKRRIAGAVVLSDIHSGSVVGLWPEHHKTAAGNIVSLGDNLHQRWLWECWNDAKQRAIDHFKGEDFIVIANGDLTEGIHHGSKEVVAAKQHDHSLAAIECLQSLTKAAYRSYFTAGTECHVGDWEEFICKELGGIWGGDKLLLEINGTLLDICHHMPTSARAYLEAGAMSISMGNARLNYARTGQRVPKVYLRGHRHVGGFFSDAHGLFVVTPAWQLLTRYGHKVVGDSICRPGITLLDWRGIPDGSLPSIHPITYDPSQVEPFRN